MAQNAGRAAVLRTIRDQLNGVAEVQHIQSGQMGLRFELPANIRSWQSLRSPTSLFCQGTIGSLTCLESCYLHLADSIKSE